MFSKKKKMKEMFKIYSHLDGEYIIFLFSFSSFLNTQTLSQWDSQKANSQYNRDNYEILSVTEITMKR